MSNSTNVDLSNNQSVNQAVEQAVSQSINQPIEDESWRSETDDREVWLKIWNQSTDPAKVSCVTAFDILYYCYSPANQLRSIYRTGKPAMCERQKQDVKLCADVMVRKIEGKEAMEALRNSRDHFVVREPHVWQWREQPTSQWRISSSQSNQSINQSDSQSTSQLKPSYSELVKSIQGSNESSSNQSYNNPNIRSLESDNQSDECRTTNAPGCQSIASKVQNYMLKVWKHSTGKQTD